MNFKGRDFITFSDLTILLIINIFFFIIDKIKEPKTQKQITNFYQFEI